MHHFVQHDCLYWRFFIPKVPLFDFHMNLMGASVLAFQDESLKGTVHPKMKFCRHLLTFMSLQTCMSFLLLYTKDGDLKNVGIQTVDGSHWLP